MSRLRETESDSNESIDDTQQSKPASNEGKQQFVVQSRLEPTTFASALLESWFDETLVTSSPDSATGDFAAYAPMVLPAAGAQGDASAPTPTNSAPFRNPTATSEPERQATDATTQFVPEADGDGVAATTEFAAPNRGDGNADGKLDSLQANVASLQAATNGEFVTLESAGHSLRNVTAVDPASPSLALRANSPSLPYGLFDFEIHDVTPGGSATVRMILPDDAAPTGYLKYDPASGALDPFVFDGQTGAEIDGSVITLYFVDGGRGDQDGVANGVIVDPGGGTETPFVSVVAIDTTAAKFKVDDVTGTSTGAFAVYRAGDLTDSLTVNYIVDSSSTAIGGTDYQSLSGTVVINSGQHSAGIIVQPFDNAATNSTKIVRIALAASPDYIIVNADPVEVSISETTTIHPSQIELMGDKPRVGVVTLDANAAELPVVSSTGLNLIYREAIVAEPLPGGGEGTTWTHPASVTVNYSVSGSATPDQDYEQLSGSVPLPYAIYAAPEWVTPIDDVLLETPEYVTITLTPDATYDIVLPGTGTVTIHDNELPGTVGDWVWLDQDADGLQDAGETGFANVTVLLLDDEQNVIGSTATDVDGYYTFTGLDPNETYQIQVVIPTGYEATPIFAGAADLDSNIDEAGYSNPFSVATGQTDSTIDAGLVPPTPRLFFDTDNFSAYEYEGFALVAIVRAGDLSGTATVQVSTSDGTATASSDYTSVSETVTFDPGDSLRTVMVPIVDDGVDEGDETVNLSLANPTNATIVSPAAAVLTLHDPPPLTATVRFSTDNFNVLESVGQSTITVLREGRQDNTVTVQYATGDGTAVSPDDYVAQSGTLTFAPYEMSQTFDVTVIDDAVTEDSEFLILTLSNPTEADLVGPNPAMLTIKDELPIVSITASDPIASEVGLDSGTFVVSRTGSATDTLEVFLQIEGSATNGEDYRFLSESIYLMPGVTSMELEVAPLADELIEGDEIVDIEILPHSGYLVGSSYQAAVVIEDVEDVKTLTAYATDPEASESGDEGEFTFVRTGDVSQALTASFTLDGSTATNAVDYQSIALNVQFQPNEAIVTLPITPIDDAVLEDTEFVYITLLPITGYILGQPPKPVQIADKGLNLYFVNFGGTKRHDVWSDGESSKKYPAERGWADKFYSAQWECKRLPAGSAFAACLCA